MLEWWQADGEGEYVDRLRATIYTNAKGQYKYETEPPGLYVTAINNRSSRSSFSLCAPWQVSVAAHPALAYQGHGAWV